MDEKLKSTIQRIKLLSEQNPEFKQEMQKMFGKTTSASVVTHDERIFQMAKYLGLDVYIDHMDSVIDYSFISEEEVRNTLESDNREMIRFRYGTRYHASDFKEFCKFALFQVEMLINYYYFKKENTIEDIVKHIREYNADGYMPSEVNTISSIPLNTKLWAFKNEHNMYSEVWENVRKVRNELSHRSPEADKLSIEQYFKYLKSLNLPLKQDGDVNWNAIKKVDSLKNTYESKVKDNKEYKQYKYLLWLYGNPFESVIEGLKAFSKQICYYL